MPSISGPDQAAILVHARRKRNAMDRSIPLTAAKSSAVRPPSWRCSAKPVFF